jgi:MoxR-like ATPase
MSGGAFDYNQYKIGYIADQIEEVIVKNGLEKTREELKNESWRDDSWYEKYPEDLFHYKYPDEVIEKMKEAVKALKIAQEYAQRVDWLLSGDDGEESFLSRLEENLKKIE